MKKSNTVLFEQLIVPAVIIAIAALMRIIPHPANVAPIAAMALFGGMYANRKYALVIPLLALLVSDSILGFYKDMPFIYGSFLLIGILGLYVRNHASPTKIITVTVLSSLLFFIITNFGVWLLGTIYPKTAAGLLMCFTAALPFFRNTLLGDMLYMGVFVIGYKTIVLFIQSTEPATLPQKE
jgi:hypothetical protein